MAVEIEESVIQKIRQRRDVGRKKYGVSMERTDLSTLDWLRHAQMEGMDFVIYLEKLIQREPMKRKVTLKQARRIALRTIEAAERRREQAGSLQPDCSADTLRLDWLLETGCRVVKAPSVWEVYFPSRALPSATGDTAREAIDAAMNLLNAPGEPRREGKL